MKERIPETNITQINDYGAYRQESDNQALLNNFFAKHGAEPKVEEVKQEPDSKVKKTTEPKEDSAFARIAKDIARGTIGEGPRAAVSGIAKGVNEMLDTVNQFNQFLGDKFAEGVVSVIGDEEQKARVKKITAKDKEEFKPIPEPTFGVFGEASPKSVTGNLIEDIAQFLTGFGVAGKALVGLKTASKAAKTGKTVVQSGIGDALAFDEQEQRLSDVVQGTALANPVTDYLESEESDTTAEAKFKQFLEGAGLGAIGEGLGKTISIMRRNRSIKKSIEAELAAKTKTKEPGLDPSHLSSLGRPESNRFIYKKIDKAKMETEGLSAKQIDELAQKPPSNADEIEINFARIDSPEDLKVAMQAYANETKLLPKVDKARRGVRPNEVTLKAAEDIDAFKTLLERREGQALNAEQITAARNFYHSTTEKLMELAKKAASPEASDIDQYAFRKMVATHHAVQKEVLGARAEAGRALQAWSIPSTGTSSEKLKGMETILDSFGGAEESKVLARKLSQFGDGQLTLSQINYLTEKSAYARTRDAMVEAWTAALLTNPATHVVNLTSNTLTTLLGASERYVQAAFPKSEVTFREANNFALGILQSQKQAIANAGRAFRTGQVGFGQSKIELPRVRATSKEQLDATGIFKPAAYGLDYYGRVVNTSFKALAAGDEYAKTVLYNAELNALATRKGIGSGLQGKELTDFIAKTVSAPDEALAKSAREFADYSTFTKELGRTGKDIQAVLSRYPEAKFIVPFYKTPTNIFKYTLERTPLAPLSGAVQKELRAGGTRQAAALSKIGLSSSMMLLGVDLSINNQITGAGPSDPKKRAALRRIGWQPNSIKIGDEYYAYGRLEPLSTFFTYSSNMAEILTNYEMYDIEAQDELDKISTATILAMSEATLNKTFLQGISTVMEALSDPDRFAPSYIRRTLSSLVPAGVAATERAVSPEKEYVTNITDAFKARIPGFSDDLPKMRNVYGDVISYRTPEEGALAKTQSGIVSMFNPFYRSEIENDPLDEFLLQKGYFINMPSKNQTFENIGVDLREYPDMYSRLVELRGQGIELMQYGGVDMKTALTDLVKGDSLRSQRFLGDFSDQEEKQAMITKIVRDYNDAAKQQLREEYPVLEQIILEEKLKQEENDNIF